MPLPESATLFLARQAERLRRVPRRKRIVFPEGEDPRVREAARRLSQEQFIEPILLPPALPDDSVNEPYAALFFERRRAKGVTLFEAAEITRQPLYRAALMVA